MKMIKTLAVVCAFGASSAFAADPQLADMTCEELRDKYEVTPEAQARFADLQGSCEGVYTINGELYVKTTAVVRRAMPSTVTLFLPSTGRTFDAHPDADAHVLMGGQKVRTRNLNRGDEFSIYLSVDKHATERVDSIAFATEDAAVEEIIVVTVVVVAALPTTG